MEERDKLLGRKRLSSGLKVIKNIAHYVWYSNILSNPNSNYHMIGLALWHSWVKVQLATLTSYLAAGLSPGGSTSDPAP